MARATLTLAGGAKVVIEGSPDEVHRLLTLLTQPERNPAAPRQGNDHRKDSPAPEDHPGGRWSKIATMVATIQKDKDWSLIEQRVFGQAGSRLARILLCLEFSGRDASDPWLTAREIEGITDELGARIEVPNVYKVIRLQGNRCVVSDREGNAARFKINLRGHKTFLELLALA